MEAMVALLRGINVGGRNRLAMADLRAAAESCGCESVRTYIQSGNLVFESPSSDPHEIGDRLARAIADTTSVRTDVVVRTTAELEAAVAANPYLSRTDDASQLHVAFVPGSEEASLGPLDVASFAPDEARAIGREVFLFLPGGMARSKLAVAVDRALGGNATVRNWRTTTTLLEMVQDLT